MHHNKKEKGRKQPEPVRTADVKPEPIRDPVEGDLETIEQDLAQKYPEEKPRTAKG